MANDTVITVVGHTTADAELRFTSSGTAVANFTVASTPRRFNKQTSEWEDQEALFLRCSVWRDYAEHVAESLTRGTHVVVVGKLKQRNWEDKEGNKRTSYELDVDEVGTALRYATVQVKKAARKSAGGTDDSAWDTPNAVPNGGADDPSIPF